MTTRCQARRGVITIKRIIVCADGTWNRPEKNLKEDVPSNVLQLARAIKPLASNGVCQQVFYDWGIGSYYDPVIGGATGKGIDKNIMDNYRYIVQNYSPGDQIFLFGFSRGAYTVRCLSGLINNCGILKRPDARLIQVAFDNYKKSGKAWAPTGDKSAAFRKAHSWSNRDIHFIGVWDTVGALGVPFSFLGLLNDVDEFYDSVPGGNIRSACHAMAIDEFRRDFEPTIWEPREGLNLKQVWFSGAHSDVGGGYNADRDGTSVADIPLQWMMKEASDAELSIEPHLKKSLNPNSSATVHRSRRHYYRLKTKLYRSIDHGQGDVLIHRSVKQRWEAEPKYRPKNLVDYVAEEGWTGLVN